MYHDAQTFLAVYEHESGTTAKVLGALTDESLKQAKVPGHNTLGDIAWHLAAAPFYMLNQVGFHIDEAYNKKPEPLTAEAIKQTHAKLAQLVKEQAAALSPEDLAKVHRVFGMMDWTTGVTLGVLLHHEVHHRGQLSVLMRQAGLVVPSIYGPTFEMNMENQAKPA